MRLQEEFVSICNEHYQQHKKRGLSETIDPIDIVIDIATSDLDEQNFSNTLLQTVNATQSKIINKIRSESQIEKLSNSIAFTTTSRQSKPIITAAFIIEIIAKKFLNEKGLKDYEKMQWVNLIAFFKNINTQNEAEEIQLFLKRYNGNLITKIYLNNDDISLSRLESLYGRLTTYINYLVNNNIAQHLTNSSTNKIKIENLDYVIIAINDLYLRNPTYSKHTKSYWEAVIKLLSQKKEIGPKHLTLNDIASLPQFHEIQNYIAENKEYLESKFNEQYRLLISALSESYNYSKERFEEDISTPQLISAITEKFLTNDNLYSNEVNYWLTIIEDLITSRTDVGSILIDPNNHSLKLFLYEDFLLRLQKTTQPINLEEYKETLKIELNRLIEDLSFTSSKIGTAVIMSLYRVVYYSLRALNEYDSVFETLKKHNSLFLVLDLLLDIKQFSNHNLYPKIAPIYEEFLSSKASVYLDNKILFKLKNTLDEVVVTATKKDTSNKLNISFEVESQYDYGYLIVKPEHILKFISKFIGQEIAFRNAVISSDDDTFEKEGKKLKIGKYEYEVYRYNKNAFDRVANLKPESFNFRFSSGSFHFKYHIEIFDLNGELLFSFNTIDYNAFEHLTRTFKFTPDENTIAELIETFEKDFKNAGSDKDKIDKLYASLPHAFYNRSENNINRKEKDQELKNHLIVILSGEVDETFGTNEELAVVNIVKAMSPEYAYNLFQKNTNLLYKIFRKLHQYWVTTGTAYEAFGDYMIELILKFGQQKGYTAVWFSNENWAFNRIELDVSDWGEHTSKINLKNYYQKAWIPLFNPNGSNEFISDIEQDYHPLDLVEMQTMVNGKPESIVKIPMFMLYHKAESKANWDTFNVVTDIISVLSVYGAGRVLISKTLSLGAKALAGAVIAKEISSKAIQHEGLTSWLQREHKTLYTTWTTVDTIGDFAMLFTSLAKADDIINNSKNLFNNLVAAEIAVPEEYLRWLEKAKRALGELFPRRTPEYGLIYAMEGISSQNSFKATTYALNFTETSDDARKTLQNVLRGKTDKTVDSFKKELGGLMNTASGKFLEDLTNLAVSLKGFAGDNQKLFDYILEFERIKLTKGQSALTGEQIKRLQELNKYSNIKPALRNKILKYIFDSPTGKLKINQVISRFNKNQIYDSKINSWRLPNTKEKINQIKKWLEKKELKPKEAEDAIWFLNNVPNSNKTIDEIKDLVQNSKKVLKKETGHFIPKDKSIDIYYQTQSKNNLKPDKELKDHLMKDLKKREKARKERDLFPKKSKEYIAQNHLVIQFTEILGEKSAIKIIEKYFPGYKPVANIAPHGGKRDQFDLVFKKGNNYIIVEAKGGTSTYNSRIIKFQEDLIGLRVQQGTRQYLVELNEVLLRYSITKALAEDIIKALDKKQVRYFGIKQKLNKDKLGNIEIKEFKIY
ncbi:protein of unknown function [Tenacibaculum sp. 190524A05c]